MYIYLCLNPERAMATETDVESGTSQSKSGTSVNWSNSGNRSYTKIWILHGIRLFRP